MRIVIDLQGAQSIGSRKRGIGRYSLSLAKAIVRNSGTHEVFVALNGLFADTIEPIRAAFEGLLPQERIRVWQAVGPVNGLRGENDWRRRTAELVREAFLTSLKPDIILITSLFEGLGDDVVTSIGMLSSSVPTAVILYDLIPLIHRQHYLENPVVAAWYENKLDHLRRASLLLSISESSRQEGIRYLSFPPERIVNISTAADPQYLPQPVSRQKRDGALKHYGLQRPFVMYTGGIDYRKNIEGLIRSYARLAKPLRTNHQLAIVCSIEAPSRAALEALANEQGLGVGELVLTGFVPDEDLVSLYNLCKVFVLPSWHEGFGLPALEAMSCGRAVIGANNSSVPEVIGREDALFDPRSDESIADKLSQVLTNDAFRSDLERHGLAQAKNFSWDKSSMRAIAALEDWHARQVTLGVMAPRLRPKLAYVSPLPPERSGISDYSAELLPELARHYSIDVIVAQKSVSAAWIRGNCPLRSLDWFRSHATHYGRVLYHFGNSHFHQHMFGLLAEVPGIVVLHDFFLSGIAAHMAHQKWASGVTGTWEATLCRNHGYGALLDFAQKRDVQESVNRYPCNKEVLQNAQGVIVHSDHSRRLARQWYGRNTVDDWVVVPTLRAPAIDIDRGSARRALGIGVDDFIVCSFGLLGPTKLNKRLLNAWLDSELARNEQCKLFFVGENHLGDYGADLLQEIARADLKERVVITGWVDFEIFRQYLAAADVGVQLRTLSRGETSAAVIDCMNHSLPTIVNAEGSMVDLPDDAVWKLAQEFDDGMLVHALESLWRDVPRRKRLGAIARELALSHHAPRACADQYAKAIESMFGAAASDINALTRAIADEESTPVDVDSWVPLANAVALSISAPLAERQLLLDISGLVQGNNRIAGRDLADSLLLELLGTSVKGYQSEPVRAVPGNGYLYARRFTLGLLGCPVHALDDEPIEFRAGDIFLGIYPDHETVHQSSHFYQMLRRHGVMVLFFVDQSALAPGQSRKLPNARDSAQTWLSTVFQCDGVICSSHEVLTEIESRLPETGADRLRPFYVGKTQIGGDCAAVGSAISQDDAGQLKARMSQSAQQLLDVVLNNKWTSKWTLDGERLQL